METYLLKPETCFPKLKIHNNIELAQKLGLQDSRQLKILFRLSGIDAKYSVYNFKENKLNEKMTDICSGAVNKLLETNNIDAKEIDGIIACHNTSDMQVPGLTSRLFEMIDFKHEIHNYPLFGLGCASFLGAINLAQRLLLDRTINNILIACCDVSTLCYTANSDVNDAGQMMTIALFGDGAAATLVTKNSNLKGAKAEILDTKVATHFSASMTVTNGTAHLDEMMLENISPYVSELVDSLLSNHNLGPDEIKHWVIHSGGKKILSGVQKLFNLSDCQMLPSMQSYRDYGNLSAVSVPSALNKLFSLCDTSYPKKSGDLGIILGFGSGFFLGASLVRYL